MNGPKRHLRFGIITIALTVTSLAQFGTAVAAPGPATPVTQTQYCGNGISAVRIIPPHGFSPLSATNAQLEAEGLPDRPTETSAFNLWERFVTNKIRYQSSCALLVNTNEYHGPQTPTTPSEYDWSYSPVWAGNVATSHTYSNAEVSFQIPSVRSNNDGVNGYSSSWVGLGSGDSSAYPLVQAGSDSYDYGPGYPAYYVWWEVFPQISAQHVNVSVYAGDHVSVYVSENSTTATMRIVDTDRSLDVTYTYKGSWNYSAQAEWIYERPLINNGIPQLADAPPMFNNAQAAYSGSYHSVGSLTHYFDRMYDCTNTTLLASPGSISANGLSYSEIFYNHGPGNNC